MGSYTMFVLHSAVCGSFTHTRREAVLIELEVLRSPVDLEQESVIGRTVAPKDPTS